MKLHYALVLFFSLFASLIGHASPTLDELKSMPFENSIMTIKLIDNQPYLVIFDTSKKMKHDTLTVYREIRLPIETKLNTTGIDQSFLIGPGGDQDLRTGFFKNLKGHSVQDVFYPFSGKAFNVGVILMGGGKSWSTNKKDITFVDSNLNALIAPGLGMGSLNVGLTAAHFMLEIFPNASSAHISISLLQVENGKKTFTESKEETIELKDLMQIKFQ